MKPTTPERMKQLLATAHLRDRITPGCTPEVARLNKAVEYADFLTLYAYDRCDALSVVGALKLNEHNPAHREAAIELERAAADIL